MQRITAVDVARAAGVSATTVSFVLNDTPGQTISDVVRARVLAEAERLSYTPHPLARALATGQSRIVLVVLPDWSVEHPLRLLLEEISTVLDEAGYSLVTMNQSRSGHATPLWETLHPDVVMSIEPLPKSQAAAIRRANVRLLGPETRQRYAFDVGPELQAAHLIEQGHTSIAYAATTARGVEAMNADRLRRVSATAAVSGTQVTTTPVDKQTAPEVIRAWLDSGVSGVVAFNDDIAAHVLGAALRAGVRVPADLAIIGHDDTPLAEMMVPSLSSIRLDLAGLGRHAAERALAAARGQKTPPIDPPGIHTHLVRRESS